MCDGGNWGTSVVGEHTEAARQKDFEGSVVTW